jgi:hypothetical protein
MLIHTIAAALSIVRRAERCVEEITVTLLEERNIQKIIANP